LGLSKVLAYIADVFKEVMTNCCLIVKGKSFHIVDRVLYDFAETIALAPSHDYTGCREKTGVHHDGGGSFRSGKKHHRVVKK
jgi:hypothetical protein